VTEPEEEPQEPLTVEPEPETEGAQFLPENTGKNPWNQGESSKNVGKIRENHGILPWDLPWDLLCLFHQELIFNMI
jgi:hypothetical protein